MDIEPDGWRAHDAPRKRKRGSALTRPRASLDGLMPSHRTNTDVHVCSSLPPAAHVRSSVYVCFLPYAEPFEPCGASSHPPVRSPWRQRP